MNVIERVKHELKYNTGPAIPYIKLGKGDADTLVKMAEDNQARLNFQTLSTLVKQTHEIERLRKALQFFADNENYIYGIAGECIVLDDGRQIAREALRIGKESNAL